ncbi:MAG: hypothetical protein Q8R81_04555 [Novosphingobium sp.]|uniref:hypothetical protein n=1 Tax=Novosphingobium sp. TaxID=1874826 RepID=UPI002735266C|nr:hypothetical protein [Novosphingobium sp.]MDP3549648.1 hypothetical protein [Novosphingobium sp.]
MTGPNDVPPEQRASLQRQLDWNYVSKAEFVVLISLVAGATSAFASLLRVAVQQISGPAMHLAELAVGASILHGVLLLLMHFTSPKMIYTRFLLAHISGALLAGSLFGGMASIWH